MKINWMKPLSTKFFLETLDPKNWKVNLKIVRNTVIQLNNVIYTQKTKIAILGLEELGWRATQNLINPCPSKTKKVCLNTKIVSNLIHVFVIFNFDLYLI